MPNRPAEKSATLRVDALGTFEIRGADGQPVPAGRQTKRQAVLLYLLLARPYGIHRRDSVLGVFWPDTPRVRGSHSLSQALNWLTHQLGEDIILRPGADEVGIDGRLVTCDAREFVTALGAGEHEHALELYRGELAPGLHVQGGGEFERWLDGERRHLNSLATEAAEWLLSNARQRGDDAAALRWARRWHQLDPYGDEALRGLAELHADRGDTAAAVLVFEDFARRLAEDLELAPSAETTAWIAGLRRSHAASEPAPVATLEREVTTADPAAGPAPPGIPAPSGEPAGSAADPRRRRRRAGIAAAALLLIVVLAGIRLLRSTVPVALVPSEPRIAVMFFNDDSEERTLGPLAAGITVALTSELAALEGLDVLPSAAMRTFEGRNPPLDTLRDRLQARWIIGGSMSSSEDLYRVNVELIDAETGTSTSLPRIERRRDEVFALIDAIVREVSAGLREKLGREIRHDGWKAGTNLPAWLAAIQADELRMDAEAESRQEQQWRLLELADSFAVQAIAGDRRWPEAWLLRGRIAASRALLERSDVAAMRESLERALAYADSSLARGDNAGARELRGSLLLNRYQFMPPADADSADALLSAAESDLRRALMLDGRRPLALARLAQNYNRQGRFREAFAVGQQAQSMDVFLERSLENAMNMFTYAFHMGDDDEAANYCDEVGRLAADSNMHASCRLDQLAWGEQTPQSLRLAEYTFENAGAGAREQEREDYRPFLAMKFAAALARAGRSDSARAVIDAWRDRAGVAGDLREQEAAVWVVLQQPDTAIALLGRVLEARPASRSRIVAMRYFRDLEDHPEFRVLRGGTPAATPDRH